MSRWPSRRRWSCRSTLQPRTWTGDVVAVSDAFKATVKMARRIARGVIPVLLHGETGSGKEVVARFIHDAGPRKDEPMVAVNCAAIPSQLVESTLFGHERGAFTGATNARPGVFEAAHGGTVLLDEIGELPAAAQAALLRVLETKRVTRVGATNEIAVDVRILAASHRDLAALSERGEFREDLFYRLNAVTLDVPPLRERRDDILPLAEHFLADAIDVNKSTVRGMAPEARRALEAYDWPGNIRELRNAIHRAVVIAEHDVIGPGDLPRTLRPPTSDAGVAAAETAPEDEREPDEAAPRRRLRREGESYRACVERLEKRILTNALTDAGGNQSEAARRLDLPRRTLVHKLKALGVKRDADAEG